MTEDHYRTLDEWWTELEAERQTWNPIRKFIYNRCSMLGYNGWYWFTHPHRLPVAIVRNWRNNLKIWTQRARRGYSYYDVWGFDHYLMRVIIGGLTDLREHQHGHPGDVTPEEWDDILAKIIEGFETRQRMFDEMWIEISDEDQKKMDEGMNLFCERFHDLWD